MSNINDEYYKIGGEAPDLDDFQHLRINKSVLFEILKSHSKLTQAEYTRISKYNNTHFSHIAEEKMITELARIGVLEEYIEA